MSSKAGGGVDEPDGIVRYRSFGMAPELDAELPVSDGVRWVSRCGKTILLLTLLVFRLDGECLSGNVGVFLNTVLLMKS